jgi:hypothetical protein
MALKAKKLFVKRYLNLTMVSPWKIPLMFYKILKCMLIYFCCLFHLSCVRKFVTFICSQKIIKNSIFSQAV